MRGALIGCGFFAQNHLNAWRDMRAEGVELVAVHGRPYCAALARGNLFAVQFHPEKSHQHGMALFRNFIGIVQRAMTGAGR